MSDMFDFGFTAVDEDELEAVQKVSVAAESTEDRLHNLYNAIIPLLNNLKQKLIKVEKMRRANLEESLGTSTYTMILKMRRLAVPRFSLKRVMEYHTTDNQKRSSKKRT